MLTFPFCVKATQCETGKSVALAGFASLHNARGFVEMALDMPAQTSYELNIVDGESEEVLETYAHTMVQ